MRRCECAAALQATGTASAVELAVAGHCRVTRIQAVDRGSSVSEQLLASVLPPSRR
jgi:hypothetical protein